MIAILDWRAAVSLKENLRFLERADAAGRVQPREWRGRSGRFRSLTLSEDGSMQLQSFSVVAAARRLGGAVPRNTARETGTDERG